LLGILPSGAKLASSKCLLLVFLRTTWAFSYPVVMTMERRVLHKLSGGVFCGRSLLEISFTSFAIAERLLMLTTPLLNWRSIADFSVLTIVAYWLLNWARQTRVLRLLTGIGAMVFLGSLTGRLELVITAWIFHLAAIASVLLLVVVYQWKSAMP
jgi:hypothetical protein